MYNTTELKEKAKATDLMWLSFFRPLSEDEKQELAMLRLKHSKVSTSKSAK